MFGGRQMRDMAPSKGAKRFRPRKVYKPEKGGIGRRYKELDCVRLFYNLQKMGWTFAFTIEATSPRGFKYAAAGGTPEECFLKAFGQWKKEIQKPKKPPVMTMKKVTIEKVMARPAPRLDLDEYPSHSGAVRATWENVPV